MKELTFAPIWLPLQETERERERELGLEEFLKEHFAKEIKEKAKNFGSYIYFLILDAKKPWKKS